MSSKNTPSSTASGPATNPAQMIQSLQQEVQQLRNSLAQTEAQVAAIPATGVTIKPKLPKAFEGQKKDLTGFLTKLRTYYKHPVINHESTKVEIAYGLLEGTASQWFTPIMKDYLENRPSQREDETNKIFADFDEFEQKLKYVFGEAEAEGQYGLAWYNPENRDTQNPEIPEPSEQRRMPADTQGP
ncbi:hypothetical protein DL95DRAFT_486102 [Leptodontidium sp. 2 PMI_412]|nr:hypothetical protein DL95DRAFT_486102 [Leptodontidium sp. 2 PMI_412]